MSRSELRGKVTDEPLAEAIEKYAQLKLQNYKFCLALTAAIKFRCSKVDALENTI
jgi:hypothetical protein